MSINLFFNYPLNWKPLKSKLEKPYYQSLVKQMRDDIKNGLLLPGTKLPPQRELADYLEIGFTTVTRAYKLSQYEGLTYGIVGKGTYVSQNVTNSLTLTHQNKSKVLELGFISAFESENHKIQSTIVDIAKKKNISNLLNYDNPTGLPHQKKIAGKYLNEIGMNVNQQNTLIVSGGQNALTISLLGLFRPGDKILVDQFTYVNFIELSKLRGIKLIPIVSDQHGVRPDLVLQACQNDSIKGIYLMPDGNNPTATIINSKSRTELANIILQYHLILIEEDYASFFNLFREVPIPKLSKLVPNNSVYICSMSKPLISGLRVAFMRVSDQYLSQIEMAMFNTTVKTSSLDVEIVTKSLENGTAFKIMRNKMKRLIDANHAFDKVFKQKFLLNSEVSFFRPLFLNTKQRGVEIEKFCLKNGIRIFHSDRFLVGPLTEKHFFRVSLSSIENSDDLVSALSKLYSLLQQNN